MENLGLIPKPDIMAKPVDVFEIEHLRFGSQT